VDTNGFIAANTLAEVLPGSNRVGDADRDRRRVVATRWGILATGVWSAFLAIRAESVIAIWYDLGSIATASLLLPMLGALYPRVRVRRGLGVVLVLVPGMVTAAWRFGPPQAWGIPPIYVGLAVSVIIAFWGRVRRGTEDVAGSQDV
jgi:hypothetical protein